jgi:hypothetical protein
MATSVMGQAALEALTTAVTAPAPENGLVVGYQRLGLATETSELEARDILAATYKDSTDETTRARAAAGIMLALTLDPRPQGYQDRLIDAYGMHLYLALYKKAGRVVDAARAYVLAAAGRLADAQSAVDRLMEGKPKDDAFNWMVVGMTAALAGNHGAALEALDHSVAAGNAPARTYLERGRERFLVGDVEGARADLDQALKLSPGCVRCAVLRAQHAALVGVGPAAATELYNITAGTLALHWLVESLAVTALVEGRAQRVEQAALAAEKARAHKGFPAEAALASGLAAQAAGDDEAAVLALDAAVKGLPAGMLRALALRALAGSAQRTKAHARALEAVRAWEAEAGASPESAELAAAAYRDTGDVRAMEDELLRAHALDPYDPARAKVAGRPVRKAAPAVRELYRRAWRLLDLQAPARAKEALLKLEKQDKGNPYVAWGLATSQRLLDKALPITEDPTAEAGMAAVDAVKRAGKEPLWKVFPRQARVILLDTLDLTDRHRGKEAMGRFAGDPDAKVQALFKEAQGRADKRPHARQSGHDHEH